MGGNVNRDFASYDLLVLLKPKVDKKGMGCYRLATTAGPRALAGFSAP